MSDPGSVRGAGARIREAAEAAAARCGLAALAALPPAAARGLGTGAGWLAWGAGLRRTVAERQIAAAFPDRSDAWVRSTARGAYRHFGRELAEIARMDPGRPGRIREIVGRVGGVDRLGAACRRAVDQGRGGAVLVAGHLGNWEVGLAALGATGVPASVVVKPQRNRGVDRLVRRRREALGVEPIEMGRAAREAPSALRAGRVVVLAADQDALQRGVFVPFLGRPASTHRGPAALSLALDVPLVYAAVVRRGGGWRAIAERVDRSGLGMPPERPGRPGSPRAAGADAVEPGDAGGSPSAGGRPDGERVRELTRRWVALLEREIRQRPRQYLWFHRRWKTRPEQAGAARATAGRGGLRAGTRHPPSR